MIKKVSLLTVFSVTAFSGWAQESADSLVVTANRFEQPAKTVLAPTSVVTREDIERWQATSVVEIMSRLPGVDIAQSGGMGSTSSTFIRGTESRHVLVLIDGIPLNNAGISNVPDLSQIPTSLIQRIEYIRGPRSALYGSRAAGGQRFTSLPGATSRVRKFLRVSVQRGIKTITVPSSRCSIKPKSPWPVIIPIPVALILPQKMPRASQTAMVL